jgi:hypothetical protein
MTIIIMVVALDSIRNMTGISAKNTVNRGIIETVAKPGFSQA